MIGLGTIVNSLAIIAGGMIGIVFGKYLKERYQETVIAILGVSTMIMALGSCLSAMLVVPVQQLEEAHIVSLETRGIMMMIISLALGAFIGELIDIDGKMRRFGEFLRDKTGNSGDKRFIEGFVYASLTACIGAMAIMGSIQDGIYADHSTLFAKSFLDLAFIMMLTASMGKGCMFSAIPVFLFQGSITILSRFIAPFMTEQAIVDLTIVGNVLIFCVGINIVWPGKIRVGNVLPAVIIAIIAGNLGY